MRLRGKVWGWWWHCPYCRDYATRYEHRVHKHLLNAHMLPERVVATDEQFSKQRG